jgi:hypothetical protein
MFIFRGSPKVLLSGGTPPDLLSPHRHLHHLLHPILLPFPLSNLSLSFLSILSLYPFSLSFLSILSLYPFSLSFLSILSLYPFSLSFLSILSLYWDLLF